MANLNRRNFIRISAVAGAGALVFPAKMASAAGNDTPKIPTRVLGRTGIEVPILSMGVMRADNPAVVRAAYNAGLTHFDTAHGYQNGRNETMLGEFFKDKPRESFTIATKGKANLKSENFEQEYAELMETSLRRLQMDRVDIFYAHAIDNIEDVKNERLIAMLKKFKAEGKCSFIGFSTHAGKPEQIDAAIEAGIYDVCLISYNFKLDKMKETEEAIERGVKAGMGFVAMKTMTGGVEDAEGKKKVNGAACLRWVWQNNNFATAIPGFTNYDLFEDCLAAALNPEMKKADTDYIASLCNQEMLFCVNCGICVAQCTEHLPIPDIMRAYMYTYGYNQPSLSKETLAELNLPASMCSGCEECKVTCKSKFDVARKIAAVTPVMQVPDRFLA